MTLNTANSRRVGINICDDHGVCRELICTVGGWVTADGYATSLRPYIDSSYFIVGREIEFEPAPRNI